MGYVYKYLFRDYFVKSVEVKAVIFLRSHMKLHLCVEHETV
jgi:hypothetical protein